jgi:hypothetical protein
MASQLGSSELKSQVRTPRGRGGVHRVDTVQRGRSTRGQGRGLPLSPLKPVHDDSLCCLPPATGPRLPMIVYREGEPLHELTTYLEGEGGGPQSVEVRFRSQPSLYFRFAPHPSSPLPAPSAPQVRIPAHSLTSQNRQVRSRQLWGSDIYTSDSDLVAVLMHYGYIHHTGEFGARQSHATVPIPKLPKTAPWPPPRSPLIPRPSVSPPQCPSPCATWPRCVSWCAPCPPRPPTPPPPATPSAPAPGQFQPLGAPIPWRRRG